MRNSNDGPDHHLKCAFQITHRDVIWRTHGPKYRLSNFNSKCAFRIKIQNSALCRRVNVVKVALQFAVYITRFPALMPPPPLLHSQTMTNIAGQFLMGDV